MLLLYGSERLIGVRSSPNVPRSFDGFRHLMPDPPAAEARKLDPRSGERSNLPHPSRPSAVRLSGGPE